MSVTRRSRSRDDAAVEQEVRAQARVGQMFGFSDEHPDEGTETQADESRAMVVLTDGPIVTPAARLDALITAWLESDTLVAARTQLDTVVAEARAVTQVALQADYPIALDRVKAIKRAVAELDALYAQVRDPSHKAWKRVCDAQGADLKPAAAEEKRLKTLAGEFQDEQDRKRREDEARIRRDLEAREAEQRAIDAALLEEDGREAEAEAVREAPSTAPPVQLAREAYVPPVDDVSSAKRWKADIEDLGAYVKAIAAGTIPLVGVLGIEPVKDRPGIYRCTFVNQQAVSLKSALAYPGVRAYAERSMAVRS